MMRLLVALLAFFSLTGPAYADIERLLAPSSKLHDKIWLNHSAGSTATIDHSAWDRFLSAYLSADSAGVHRVDYAAVSLADRELVVSYIDSLEAVDPATLDRPEQLAFWINLYNAQTVALILENYPVDSIRDISSGLFSLGPWDQEAVTISGRTLSLNDIEHGIVRPVYQDARIHYALNCAAVSCPNLATKAFSGKRLDADLTSAEKAYVNDPRGVRLDGEKLVLSSIYNWFRDDFGQTEADIIVRLRKHATGRTADALNGRSEVDEFEYDWALNRR